MTSYGSIAGNRNLKSEAKTTNKLFFSYPGYSEILTGQAHDDVIKSNSHPQNPYPSFLDFVKQKTRHRAECRCRVLFVGRIYEDRDEQARLFRRQCGVRNLSDK